MKKWMVVISIVLAVFVTGCSTTSNHSMGMNHESMNHGSMMGAPMTMKSATNPKFAIASEAVITANDDHMMGMHGANATVRGAYATTVYTVSYTPTTGGAKVTNHKWVVHEEIADAASQPYKVGDKVTLTADHMPGMKGAVATIDSAKQTTVYMIDFTPTTGGKMIKNHLWVTEDELSKP